MSTFYNPEPWVVTQREAQELAELDEQFSAEPLPKGREAALNKVLPFYIKYRNIVKRLTECHDQIVPYQKRNMVQVILECAIARMLEYKRNIVDLTCSEYVWPVNFMVELKLTPDDIALTTPAYYTSDRKALLEQREKFIEDLIANANKPEESEVGENEIEEEPIKQQPQRKVSLQTEIYIKSLMEKKAAEEAEANRKKEIQDEENELKATLSDRKSIDAKTAEALDQGTIDREKAATIVQKIWRGYQARKLLKQKFNRYEELFRMRIPDTWSRDILEKDIANMERKRELQMLAAEKYMEIVNEERHKLYKKNSVQVMEDTTDEIRNWYLNWYDKVGFFDNFPSSEVGGSILIATGQTLTPEEYLEKQASKGEKKRGGVKERKVKGKAEKKPEKKTSKALEVLRQSNDDYVVNWKHCENQKGDHRIDLIREDIYYELLLNVREAVDDVMRLELKRLKEALWKDSILSKRKKKIPKPKKGETL